WRRRRNPRCRSGSRKRGVCRVGHMRVHEPKTRPPREAVSERLGHWERPPGDSRKTTSMNTGPSSTLHLTSITASDRPRSDQDQPQVDSTGRAPAAGERALVLGGGGSTGNAWLIGVIAGLFDGGLDVTTADLTIGTSAGSTAAAQIAGATPTELLAATVAAAPQQRTGPVGPDRGRVPVRP